MYKVIYNNKIIDVIESPKFIRFLSNGHVSLANKSDAHGLISSNNRTIYRFDLGKKTSKKNILDVEIVQIREEEFRRLEYFLNSGKQPDADESALTKNKKNKIVELSEECNRQIISGVSIVLSDDQVHHFKLTLEDQLNILLLENQLTSGMTSFVYHSTNEPCRIFSKEDMNKIIQSTKSHIQYHTTYFNLLKQYINSIVDAQDLQSVYYGIDVEKISSNISMKTFLRTLK